MPLLRIKTCAALTLLYLFAHSAIAQDQAAAVLERVRVRSTVQPLGPRPFGESINLYTGSLSFSQTDVEYPGTGPTIVLTRSVSTQKRFAPGYSFFGDWVFDIPRIETLVRRPVGGLGTPGANWIVGPLPQGVARCSQLDIPHEADGSQHLWWQGYELIMPGSRQTMMRAAAALQMPSMTHAGSPVVFTGTTRDDWRIGCLPSTSNGQTGEGFLVVDPQGTKYFLDYLIGKDGGMVLEFEGGTTIRHPIMLAAMMVSRIEDRFGNSLTFSYSGTRLGSIAASDGRHLTVNWRTGTTEDLVASIVVQSNGPKPQTTTYEYATVNSITRLTGVVRPDGSRWGFANLASMVGIFSPIGCGQRTFDPATSTTAPPLVATLTHPSGLTGQFTLRSTLHGRSYVPSFCDTIPEAHEANHPVFATYSLVSKQFSGPGLTAQTWNYTYAPVQASAHVDACATAGTCLETKWVDVLDPAGVQTRYTFSNRWNETEGKELSIDVYPSGSGTPMQSTVNAYASPSAGPYPASIGSSMLPGDVNELLERSVVPLRSQIVTQHGRSFRWSVAAGCDGYPYCFDSFGRPTKIVKSSAPAP
jgi:hypothetical protein